VNPHRLQARGVPLSKQGKITLQRVSDVEIDYTTR
jgi:hypothetical protein